MQPVARFRIASTPRQSGRPAGEQQDGDTLFLTVNVWRQAAENVAESMTPGYPRDRDRPAPAARLRDQERREAHRLGGGGGRDRPVAAQRPAKVTRADRAKPRPCVTAADARTRPARGPATSPAAAFHSRTAAYWVKSGCSVEAAAAARVACTWPMVASADARSTLRHLARREVRRQAEATPPPQDVPLGCGCGPGACQERRHRLPPLQAMLRQPSASLV